MKNLFENRQQITAYVFAILIIAAFAYQFLPFVTPIILAIIFSFAIEPKLSKYSVVHKSRKKWQTIGILLVLLISVAFPVCFIAYRAVARISGVVQSGIENSPFVQSLLRFKDNLIERIAHYYPSIQEIVGVDSDSVTKISEAAVKVSGLLIAGIPDFVISFLVFLASLYIFIVFSKQIKRFALEGKVLSPEKLKKTIEVSQNICFSTLFSSIVIGAIQATVVTVGGVIFGYHEVLLIFILTFFVSFIPVIGAGPVAFVMAFNSLVIGEIGGAIGLTVFAVFAGLIDNLIKPYIVISSAEDDTHPLIAILVFVGAVLVYGFVGLLLGPVLLALFTKLVPVLLEKEGAPEA